MLPQNLAVRTLCLICMFSVQFSSVFSQTQNVLPDRAATSLYPFSTDLDTAGQYVLRWGFNKTVIWFQVQVNATGYVGFGISESGDMAPADVMVAYVTDLVHFKDYHTIGKFHPIIDKSQDWFMDAGYKENGWTILEFHRDLDTCDRPNDQVITDHTMRLIYAYSDDVPSDEFSLRYHGGSNRGSKSVSLLTRSPPPGFLPSDTKTTDFLNNNYQIPSNEATNFHCQVFDLSHIRKKHHIIKVSPIISEATEPNVHHVILYRCHVKNPSTLMKSGQSFNCFTDAPYHVQFCREHVASFGHGTSDMFLPEDIGIPFGGPEEANVYVLATQYDNENKITGLVDNSGIRVTYTSQLRRHDSAFLSIGNIISPNWLQFIPPGEPNFVQKAYCSMECIKWGIGGCQRPQNTVPMTVVGVQFHSHSLGKAMKLRHMTRDGIYRARENPWLVNDRSYDSEHQSFRLLTKRGKVACKDELLLECTYDSTSRENATVGGWSEDDELCRAYVLYYPRKPIEGCMSWSNHDRLVNSTGEVVQGRDVFKTLIKTTWKTDTIMRRNLKFSLDHSRENGQCWTSSPKRDIPYGIDYFYQPVLTNTYTEPKPVCPKRN